MAVWRIKLTWALLALPIYFSIQVCVANPLVAIAYHDIALQPNNDTYAITVEQFREQLQYLHSAGYTPVSLQQLDLAHRGLRKLPKKPVLLTFDDGLVSFKTNALPILREFGYPSILAIVTAWVDQRSKPESYNTPILTWQELRDIQRGQDVEIISHSDNLHHAIRSNPQGNKAAAAVTHEYRDNLGYESDESLRERVDQDLRMNISRLKTELDLSPTAIAWPFGEYNTSDIRSAISLGMTYYFTLNDRPTFMTDLPRVNRQTFYRYKWISDFGDMLSFRKIYQEQQRFIEVKLDALMGLNEIKQEKVLSQMLSKLELLRPNAVIVNPFSADKKLAFFPTKVAKVTSDSLNRVIHQMRSRLHVDHIYLRLPILQDKQKTKRYYRDLAQLNRFDGALVESGLDRNELKAIKTEMRDYLPSMKIGIMRDTSDLADMSWIEIDFSDSREVINNKLRIYPEKTKLLCLLKYKGTPSVDALNKAMQLLRENGVMHYGFEYNPAFLQAENIQHVFQNFHAYVVRTAEIL